MEEEIYSESYNSGLALHLFSPLCGLAIKCVNKMLNLFIGSFIEILMQCLLLDQLYLYSRRALCFSHIVILTPIIIEQIKIFILLETLKIN